MVEIMSNYKQAIKEDNELFLLDNDIGVWFFNFRYELEGRMYRLVAFKPQWVSIVAELQADNDPNDRPELRLDRFWKLKRKRLS